MLFPAELWIQTAPSGRQWQGSMTERGVLEPQSPADAVLPSLSNSLLGGQDSEGEIQEPVIVTFRHQLQELPTFVFLSV